MAPKSVRMACSSSDTLFSRPERIVFWAGVLVLGAVWSLLPIRRDQAILLLRGWYPGWLRLARDDSPESLERARGLDQHLLTRFWLTRDGSAPAALHGGFDWAGPSGEEHFCNVLVPQVTRWATRRAGFRRDLPPWKAVFQTASHASDSRMPSLAGLEGEGLTLSSGDGDGMGFQRTRPNAAFLLVFSLPPLPSRIGEGVAFVLEFPEAPPDKTPWRLLWATGEHPGFEENRNLLIAPRQNPGDKRVWLVGDLRSIPEWIADQPVIALRLELPWGETPRGGILRQVRAAVFAQAPDEDHPPANHFPSVLLQESDEL